MQWYEQSVLTVANLLTPVLHHLLERIGDGKSRAKRFKGKVRKV
jgi:hypothetical protein